MNDSNILRQPGRWLRLAIVVGVVVAVQVISSLVTLPAVRDWYPTLIKTSWNPPSWVFGPVWTVLYLMIAWSGWRLWEHARLVRRPAWSHPAMRWFAVQLALNFAWSLLFFGLRRPDLGFIDILLLDGAIIGTLVAAWRLDRVAAWLLVPYLLWVLYATSLNGGIVWLNS